MRHASWVFLLMLNVSCGSDSPSDGTGGSAGTGTGGSSPGTGGSASGGASAGGKTSGGSSSGGSLSASGGSASGGASGMASGGSATGGSAGSATAGSGGASAGSAGKGGAAGASGGGAGGGGGATSGGSAGASTGCGGASLLFCEDFEALTDGPAQKSGKWEPVTSGGTLTLDATHARGKRALHVHTDGNGRAYINVSSFSPPGNSFFGRFYLYADAFPSAPDYAHYTLVEAAGSSAGLIRFIGGQYIPGNGALWGPGSDAGPTGDWTNWKATAKSEAGKWSCIEWEAAAADNNIRIWIDGVAKTELSVSTKVHGGTQVDFVFPTFNKIWIGWQLYQGNPTPNKFDFWFDDIALSSTRVGCQ